ncbi:MAG: 3-dehydroquinate synthase [Phaeodactylibacter sp.]|nr:3-dehydroquinate synthase [Phaeodactylibacter sp.]
MTDLKVSGYRIKVGPIAESLPHCLSELNYSRLAVLVDEHTEQHCWPLIEPLLDTENFVLLRIPSGEDHKVLSTCSNIWQQLLDQNLDRQSLLINLGGGVIGDMGGFCASTYKRGINFLQIPTTLLSQVDASIGGKLGIDFGQVKNSVGVFHDPKAVLIDPDFLRTLPDEELRSGFAEVIKHSLIADAGQWQTLRQIDDLRTCDWGQWIPASLRVKQRIVAQDPFEKGLRKALNFGHTIGHAVESWSIEQNRRLLHGEAIAIGMICEAYLSQQQGLSSNDLEAVTEFLIRIYGKVELPEAAFPDFIELMKNDKKNEAGTINFTMIPAPGEVLINQVCATSAIAESLHYYRAL